MFSERIDRLQSSIVRDILAAAQAPGVISFAGGLPASESIPRVTALEVPAELGQYGQTEGEPRLRALVSAHLAARGLECPPERILILSGSQQGIDLVSKLFIDVGSVVLTENPTYLAALQAFRLLGASLHGITLAPSGLDTRALARAATELRPRFAYCIPTFHNPTGHAYTAAARREVAHVLDAAEVPLFEDDPYRELSFDAPLHRTDDAPIAARLTRAPWVYQSSFSKTFMPGVRLGFLAASEALFGPLSRLKQAADLHSNRLGQWLVMRELTDPGRQRRLEALRTTYRDKRDHFERALRVHLADLAEWSRPAGGLFFWVRLKRTRDLLSLLPRALEAGVAFVPGEAFFVGGAPDHSYLRLNFSHAAPEQVEEGLRRLSELLRS